MTTEKTGQTIGLILANASNSFMTSFMDLFKQELDQRKCHLVIGLTNHEIDKERFYLNFFGQHTDGIIILSDSSDYSELTDVIPATIPTIFIHRAPVNCECTSIIENDYSATFQAVLNMIHSGYPNVSLICRNIKFSTSREIIQAYRDAMNTTPVGFRESCIFEYDMEDEAFAEHIIAQIRQKDCNGILAASIEVTERLAPYVYDYNMKNEHPVSLTGFSIESRNSGLFQNLDTIQRPIRRTIDLTLQQLFYLMDNPDTPRKEYIVKGSMIMRTNDAFQTL